MSTRPDGAARGSRDPRTIVTPEAFTIAPDLLGLPLASPSRRLAAVVLDLVVIGILVLLTRSFFFVVFLVVAALLLRASYRGLRDTDFVGAAFRIAVGCLGFVLLVVSLAAVVFLFGDGDDGGGPDEPAVAERALEEAGIEVREPRLRDLLRGTREAVRFRRASTAETAVGAGTALAAELRGFGASRSEAADVLREAASPEAAWAEEADRVIEAALDAAGYAPAGEAPKEAGSPDPTEPQDTAAQETAAQDAAGQGAFAPDTVQALLGRVEKELSRIDSLEEALSDEARARRRAEIEADDAGALGWLLDLVDRLGFGFGWAAVYFTLVMPWTDGQTAGKRLVGIRVVQLDGSPINWWEAFERAGGYAAGFATGLLGFAQVYWDPNRQAIHDKVAGTVVIRDGLPPVPGPWRRGRPASAPARDPDEPPPSPPAPDPIRTPPGPSTR